MQLQHSSTSLSVFERQDTCTPARAKPPAHEMHYNYRVECLHRTETHVLNVSCSVGERGGFSVTFTSGGFNSSAACEVSAGEGLHQQRPYPQTCCSSCWHSSQETCLKNTQGVMSCSARERGGFSMMSTSGGLKHRAARDVSAAAAGSGRPKQNEYLKKTQGVMSCSVGERGGFSMMSTSGGLKPSAVAGGPSVTRFTQSSCTCRGHCQARASNQTGATACEL